MADRLDDAITIQEAARLLGVSRPTVYRLVAEGRLAAQAHEVTGRKQVSREAALRLTKGRDYAMNLEPAPRVAEVAAGINEYRPAAAFAVSSLGVDSIFRLPELALELPADDVSERVDYYRFHGVADA